MGDAVLRVQTQEKSFGERKGYFNQEASNLRRWWISTPSHLQDSVWNESILKGSFKEIGGDYMQNQQFILALGQTFWHQGGRVL